MNTNTTTTQENTTMNTTTIPTHFTKRSGKQIANLLTETGWTCTYNGDTYNATVTATYLLANHDEYTLTVVVSDNGAFCWGSIIDPTSRYSYPQTLGSLSDTLNWCNVPKNEQATSRKCTAHPGHATPGHQREP